MKGRNAVLGVSFQTGEGESHAIKKEKVAGDSFQKKSQMVEVQRILKLAILRFGPPSSSKFAYLESFLRKIS